VHRSEAEHRKSKVPVWQENGRPTLRQGALLIFPTAFNSCHAADHRERGQHTRNTVRAQRDRKASDEEKAHEAVCTLWRALTVGEQKDGFQESKTQSDGMTLRRTTTQNGKMVQVF